MSNCIFCKIINKEAPGTIIYEDNDVAALVPLGAISKGHTLVIPKQHFENIFDVDEEVLAKMARVMKKISAKLLKQHKATGINILTANGKDAQQSVMHLHFHLVPRYHDDSLDMWIKQKL